jgi:hypothetical protein
VLAFLPGASGHAIEAELASVPTLSTGIVSATQGAYTTAQLLLDITQGARVSASAYHPALPPALSLLPQHGGAVVEPWTVVRKRATDAPQILEPGLLAASIPGGAGYVGLAGHSDVHGAAAADRRGRIAAISSGTAATLPVRIDRLRASERLIVTDLPSGPAGYADLRALSTARPANELLIVLQDAPEQPGQALLWIAVGGLGEGRKTLTSQTTNEHGLIAAIDLAPTILRHLGLHTPAAMRGKPIYTDGSFDGHYLRALKARLGVVSGRRLPALACLLVAWILLLLSCSRVARARERAMRVGALAMLWIPVAVLLPAPLQPSPAVEYITLVLVCFLLGALTDRLLPWPRAPLAPALAALLGITVDALAGTQLLARSLLGPNPGLGVRFYGIGNELKSALAVLVLAAVAAALYPASRTRRAAATMALTGIVLAVIEGSARIGAGVGGVILVSAGTAVATAMLLPGQIDRGRAAIVLLSPIVGLVALAALDLATAHGGGHFTGSVLHVRSAGDVHDIIVRRYTAAYDELKNHAMPVATALALLYAALALRLRDRLLAAVGADPAWLAALAGGLTAGVVGALSEDSGPVLLVVAVFTLGCVLSYLWARPLRGAVPARAVQHDVVLVNRQRHSLAEQVDRTLQRRV